MVSRVQKLKSMPTLAAKFRTNVTLRHQFSASPIFTMSTPQMKNLSDTTRVKYFIFMSTTIPVALRP